MMIRLKTEPVLLVHFIAVFSNQHLSIIYDNIHQDSWTFLPWLALSMMALAPTHITSPDRWFYSFANACVFVHFTWTSCHLESPQSSPSSSFPGNFLWFTVCNRPRV